MVFAKLFIMQVEGITERYKRFKLHIFFALLFTIIYDGSRERKGKDAHTASRITNFRWQESVHFD